MTKLTIGKVARSAGVGVETVRYYERRGLVEQPRKLGGFRDYPAATVQRIRFIKRAQDLGFSLADIEQLIALTQCQDNPRADVKQLTGRKIQEIREKVADLQRLESTLSDLHRRCSGRGSLAGCPIFESIASERPQ
ncbi:MAG: heavy metal-responsive transcriptional regulator [Planctomycetaceae bacterium]|nr:heavy metal-responsive transcriptional regulator [Planctomycetaceae bacterium]